LKLLFVCTHNRCRSILCEAIVNQRGRDLLRAASAGSAPAGAIHPLTLRYLAERGYDTAGLTSQSWDQLWDFAPDRVITVCDSAAGEACPLWMSEVSREHWGLPDPSKVEQEDAAHAAFMSVIDRIEAKIHQWLREV
jgi:arsenate reductase